MNSEPFVKEIPHHKNLTTIVDLAVSDLISPMAATALAEYKKIKVQDIGSVDIPEVPRPKLFSEERAEFLRKMPDDQDNAMVKPGDLDFDMARHLKEYEMKVH